MGNCKRIFNARERDWQLIKQYTKGGFIWQFDEDKQINHRSGRVDFGGDLTEIFADYLTNYTTYIYFPTEKFLQVDRSGFQPDPEINVCVSDKYIIEYIRADEYWLYPVKDKHQNLNRCESRIKIRRVNG